MSHTSEATLITDRDWAIIDGELCRINLFTHWASVQDGKIVALDKTAPYAAVTFECKQFTPAVTGYITHRTDFAHLWAAFKQRGVAGDEEVLFLWSKKHLKRFAKLFSAFTPRLWVMICRQGAFDLMTNPSSRPDLTGEARWNAEKPLAEWKPDVMS